MTILKPASVVREEQKNKVSLSLQAELQKIAALIEKQCNTGVA